MTLRVPSVDTRTRHQDIVDDGKDAFAPNPTGVLAPDSTVRKDGGLVEFDPSAVAGTSKRDFVGMEVFKS